MCMLWYKYIRAAGALLRKYFYLQKIHSQTYTNKQPHTYMGGDVDVVRVAWIHVDDMESHAGAIDDL